MWLSITPDEVQLKCLKLDTMTWTQALSKYKLNKQFPRRADKIAGADIFLMLYHWNPELVDTPSDPAMAQWIKMQLATTEIQEIRKKTMGDQERSVLTAVRFYQELMRPKTSNLKAVVETKHNLDTVEAMLGIEAGLAIDQLKLAQQIIADTMALKPEDTANPNDLIQHQTKESNGVTFATSKAKEGVEAVSELISIMGNGWGSSEGNRLIEFGLDEDLMRTLKGQDSFKKMMQSLGRIRLMAGEIKSRKPKHSPQPMGLTVGSDLTALVPQEYAMLGDPDLEDLFFQRFAENSLMQYDKRAKIPEGRGPIVVCIDKSGSMAGRNETNASAFFLQMVRTAQEQKRKVCLIAFATYAAKPVFIENMDDLIRIATQSNYSGIGGGTDFEEPLRKARLAINNSTKYKNADIIFLTDGICRLPSNFVEAFLIAKHELEFRLMGVLFGSHMQWGKDMLQLLDQSITVSDSGNMDWVESLLERIV